MARPFAYSTNYLIDTEHGVIMDVEATPAHRTAEVDSTRTMVERVEAQFDLCCGQVFGHADQMVGLCTGGQLGGRAGQRFVLCG